jgi:hypothetical protein
MNDQFAALALACNKGTYLTANLPSIIACLALEAKPSTLK